jgi:lipopolysaccharide biosynthesis glycosyltransferase
MADLPLEVFVGWDSREDIAFRVCRHSMQRRASKPVTVTPIMQIELRERGLYRRPIDPLASTEFTYTRFFVPLLMDYSGWALFCDCDFLWLADVAELFALTDDRYAAMCVHHDHRPRELWKMDDRQQTLYPRKNWSSMVLYNCGHPRNRALTAATINQASGSYLHRFQWLDDADIGAVPETWNWLEGWCERPATGHPKTVHYTRGGPWFDKWQDVDYAALWLAEERDLARSATGPRKVKAA